MSETVEPAAPASSAHGPRLASVVMFVHDLELSVRFYRELFRMDVTVREASAALLVGDGDSQLYLRAMGSRAQHSLGSVGVNCVIWTAADNDDLRRCEHFFEERSAHVYTETADGFTLVEGRDPSDVPVMVAYPGPDQAARHQIMSRIYGW